MKHIFKWGKRILPFLISFAILYFLVAFLDQDIMSSLDHLSLNIFLISCVWYVLLVKPLNTFRFLALYGLPLRKWLHLYIVLMYNNFLLTAIPFRLGEISYVTEMESVTSRPKKHLLADLLVARIFDYLCLVIILIASFVGSSFMAHDTSLQFVIFSVAITLISLLLIPFVYAFLKKKGYTKKLVEFIQVCKERTIGELVKVFILSFIYWVAKYLYGYWLLTSLGLTIGFFDISFISTILVIIGLIPIQTYAGFGVFEGGWIFFLSVLGVVKNDTIGIILLFHIVPILVIVLCGLLSLILKRRFS